LKIIGLPIDLNFFAFLPLNITLHSGDLALGLVLTQSKPGATRQAMLHCDSRIRTR
jgi:hypothetical protein